VAKAQHCGVALRASIFLAAKRQIFIIYLAVHQSVPVQALDLAPYLGCSHPGSVETPDQTAHAGARDVVDGNMVLLKPFDQSNMSKSQSAATFQSQADRWARLGFLWHTLRTPARQKDSKKCVGSDDWLHSGRKGLNDPSPLNQSDNQHNEGDD
jgi:hypothetical protein